MGKDQDLTGTEVPFEELSLWEVLLLFLRAPNSTWDALKEIARSERSGRKVTAPSGPHVSLKAISGAIRGGGKVTAHATLSGIVRDREALGRALIMLAAFMVALHGTVILMGDSFLHRPDPSTFDKGVPFLVAGAVLWAAPGIATHWRNWLDSIRRWRLPSRHRKAMRDTDVEPEPPDNTVEHDERRDLLGELLSLAPPDAVLVLGVTGLILGTASFLAINMQPPGLLMLAGWVGFMAMWLGGVILLLTFGVEWGQVLGGQFALALSVATYFFTPGNRFNAFNVFLWLTSVALWLITLAGPPVKLAQWARGLLGKASAFWHAPRLSLRFDWTALAALLIAILACYTLCNDLNGVPPEMTSDHVEKLLDAYDVFTGRTQIFFPNNGGREPIQMYLVALAAQIPGWGFTFMTLKLVSVAEALIGIPLIYLGAKEVTGGGSFGRKVGLVTAGLVAASYWYAVVGRMGLRIILMPAIIGLLLMFLSRAMRRNRRGDFLIVGLLLGIGTYAYQALRIAPLIAIAGTGLAMIYARENRERLRYLGNLMAAGVVAMAVFVPMGHFMIEFPELFWMRTIGRLSEMPVEDPWGQFWTNMRDAFWMFHWSGDVAWINNAPNAPALDVFSGALLALGGAAWLIFILRRRDPVAPLIPIAFVIMMLPSTLALALPVENPSFTRISGTLPIVYMMAALPLVLFAEDVMKAFPRKVARWIVAGLAALLLTGAAGRNMALYFGGYLPNYLGAAQVHNDMGALVRGFADSIGSMETAFVIPYPYWVDVRAVGIAAGDITWENRYCCREPEDYADQGPFDPSLALMFIYHQNDVETDQYLRDTFPEGYRLLHHTRDPAKDYYVYIVPPGQQPPPPQEAE